MAGVPLLPGILPANARVIAEIAFGSNLNIDASNWQVANQWIDVTTDLWQANGQRITINPMGRSERFGQAQPAACGLVLDNTTGKYGKGPASSNWPFVRPNTPLRISVTLNGITLFVRFFGYIESWEPHDDTTAKTAWVNVTAWGKMHTIDLKDQVQLSPLARAVLADRTTHGLYQYWTCEDGTTSAQIGSALTGGPAMSLVFAGGLGPGMAMLDPTTTDPGWLQAGLPPYGTLPLPQMSNGSGFQVSFPPGNASAWTVQFGVWIDFAEVTVDTNIRVLAEWQTPGGTYVRWRMIADHSVATFGTYLVAYKADGTSSTVGATGQGFNSWDEIRVEAVQSGGNINVFWAVNGGLTRSGTFTTATLAGVAGFIGNPDHYASARNFTVGHVRIWDQAGVPDYQPGPPSPTNNLNAWYGHLGETATARLTRLCGQQGLGLPLLLTGSSAMAMGVQKTGTLPDLLRECEAADQGVLYDGVSQGLAYVARSAKYNQAATLTLNAAAAQLDPPFEPKDQDPQRRNTWVIGRRDGSTATVTDKTGPLGTDNIGPLSKSVTGLVLASDAQLLNIGGWLLRLGTVNEPYYYPTLKLDLSAIPSLAFDWLSTAIGERIDITNLSAVSTRHPPGTVSLILEGYSEILSPYEWTVTANCSPEPPWRMVALNTTFRLEMASQTLAANLVQGATSLSLATAAGHQLFTRKATYPNDFPPNNECLLIVGGWPIRVTDATGVASPQTLTIDPAPNTSTILAGAPVTLWRPAALAL